MPEDKIKRNLAELVRDRMNSLDHPRKTWLLEVNKETKPSGIIVLPFPEFSRDQGRAGVREDDLDFEYLTYTRSDALNMVMALAGNNESGKLSEGSWTDLVSKYPRLVNKFQALHEELLGMPEIDSLDSPYLFQNEMSVLKVRVGREYTNNSVGIGSNPSTQGFKVPVEVGLEILEQVVDQLLEKSDDDRYSGLRGAFYDKFDAQYLVKMVGEFTGYTI